MNKITKCKNYYIFNNIDELHKKVDIERFIEDNFVEYPYDIYWAEPIDE